MDPLIIIGIVVFVLIGALVLIIVGLRASSGDDPLESRLADYVSRGETVSLEEIELSQTFSDRVLIPLARRLGELTLRFTPQNAIQQTTQRLEQAGNPGNMEPTEFFSLRFIGHAGCGPICPGGEFSNRFNGLIDCSRGFRFGLFPPRFVAQKPD